MEPDPGSTGDGASQKACGGDESSSRMTERVADTVVVRHSMQPIEYSSDAHTTCPAKKCPSRKVGTVMLRGSWQNRRGRCPPQRALFFWMILGIFWVRLTPAQKSSTTSSQLDRAQESGKAMFSTTNETLFTQDAEASRLAKTFASQVAKPIKSMFPRTYSANEVNAQMQMTGFFEPNDLKIPERAKVRNSFSAAINKLLAQDERCCVAPTDVSISNVCFWDYTGCLSMVLKSRPGDCGDAKNIDPEECDDGNKNDGDGCSSTCKVEEGHYCVGGNRFTKDICRDENQSMWFRRDGHAPRSTASWLGSLIEEPQLVPPDEVLDFGEFLRNSGSHVGKNMSDVHTGKRSLMQAKFGGSIVVSLKVEFVRAHAAAGNRTMKIRHIFDAMRSPEFLRRFQEQMREREKPVVVTWTKKGAPETDVYSGPPQIFYAELMEGKDLMKCLDEPFTHPDGTACAYLDYVAIMTLLGLFLSGMVILSCTTFCCARFFPCCYWIGIPCRVGRQCGGALPTKRRKINDILRSTFLLMLTSCAVMGITIIGYRCTQQVLYDISTSIYAIEAAQQAPKVFRASVSNSTMLLKAASRDKLATINLRLSGLPALKKMTQNANKSLEETAVEIVKVQNLIEGYRNTLGQVRNPCTYVDAGSLQPVKYDSAKMLWRLPNGAESPTDRPEGYHIFKDAIPSTLPNGRKSPVCEQHIFYSYVYSTNPMGCPCCRHCSVYYAAMRDTLASMPSMQTIELLNTTVPYQLIDNDIDQLMAEMNVAIQLVEDWLVGINKGLDGIKFALRLVVQIMPGLTIFIWGSSWAAVLIVWIGIALDRYRFLFGAFFVGFLATAFVFFPVAGLGSMAVIPMSDFCNGIPITGSDTSSFLKTFSPSGDIMDVNRSIVSILTDCFTKPDGTLWNVVDLDRPAIVNRLQKYDLSKKINPKFFDVALNTKRRDLTAPFTNHYRRLVRMTSDNKLYGYDSMPLTTIPNTEINVFQIGGVLQGSRSTAMIRQINQMISSALSLKQLEETCNLRTETLAAQNQWQRFGGTGTLKDACVTNNTQMYNDERYGCCPGDRFWAPGSRQPAQVVYDYLIYKKELQRNIDSMKVKANDADFHIGNIKKLSLLLERNLTAMTTDAVDAINNITDQLFEIGSCKEFNRLYEDVRTPLCDELSSAMDAFWIACFLAGSAWLPFFWTLLRNSKIVMLRRGLGERRPFKRPKKGGGLQKVAPTPGDILQQV